MKLSIIHTFLCTILALSGLMACFAVNPIESILFLILCFCISGAILFTFNIEFLGLIYIIVYVGAVAILFLFIIMMLDVKIRHSLLERIFLGKYNIFLAVILLLYPLIALINLILDNTFFISSGLDNFFSIDSFKTIDTFGQILFNYYTINFLIAGIVLLIALLGCIVLTLKSNLLE